VTGLLLRVRTPQGLALERPVDGVVAEDHSGWFGLRPGRLDLVAALPPGLLRWSAGEEEGFVAHSGGLLDLRGGECRVLCTDAVADDRLERIADQLAAWRRRRERQAAVHRGLAAKLAHEALRRLAAQGGR
jgi:F-type H+-transporting ATPase subunit epsilon